MRYTYRENSNTASDFAQLITALIADGTLHAGHILVMDNAKVHNDNQNTQDAFDLLTANGIVVRRLPTYSPELNPCELVFGFVKNHLRTSPRRVTVDGRLVDIPFAARLEDALGLVTFDLVEKFYNKCKRAEHWRK